MTFPQKFLLTANNHWDIKPDENAEEENGNYYINFDTAEDFCDFCLSHAPCTISPDFACPDFYNIFIDDSLNYL